MEIKMKNSNKIKYQIIWSLMLAAFILYWVGSMFIIKGMINLGITMVLLNSAGVIIIGYLFQQIMRIKSPITANIYLITRILEWILLAASGLIFVLFPTFIDGEIWSEIFYRMWMVILGLWSLGLCLWLIINKYIYTFLAYLGLIGYICLVLAMMVWFLWAPLWEAVFLIPATLFELIFGLILIIKGLNSHEKINE